MSIYEVLYCTVIILSITISLSILLHEKKSGISPTPTMPGTRRAVINLMKKHFDQSQNLKIAELGCGWGGLVRKLAYSFENSSITGFEISPWPLMMSRLLTCFNHRIVILNKDFLKNDFSEFDVLICYLSPQHMEKIEKKWEYLERRPLLISCAFSLPNHEPNEVISIRQIVNVNIYAYK